MKLPIRALVVDDEPLARRHLRSLLAEDSEVEVVGECATGVEAVDAITAQRPDLVFLDIQMPELDGVGVAEAIGAESMPLTIFVTAHDDRALDAFRVHALDYVLKPVERERFAAAVSRAKDTLRGRTVRDPGRLSSLLAAWRASPEGSAIAANRLIVRVEGRTMLIRPREIDWISSDDNNVHIHIAGRDVRVRETLSALEERLAPSDFIRVHRTALVNSRRVAEIRPSAHGEYLVVLANGTQVPTGRRYRDIVRGMMRKQ